MITSVNILNQSLPAFSLNLPLSDVSGGYVVQSIDGLGPVKATLVSSSFANVDGEHFDSSRRDARNIKLQLGLRSDLVGTSVAALRKALYDVFMPKSSVKLTFRTSEGVLYNISGIVETCDPSVFTKEPAVDISIMCYDPDFVASAESVFNALTPGDYGLTYPGTIDTGVRALMTANRNVSTLQFSVVSSGLTQLLTITTPIVSGDLLEIVTSSGKKGVWLTHSGVRRSILYSVSGTSVWPKLYSGLNTVKLLPSGSGAIPYAIRWTTKYGGL